MSGELAKEAKQRKETEKKLAALDEEHKKVPQCAASRSAVCDIVSLTAHAAQGGERTVHDDDREARMYAGLPRFAIYHPILTILLRWLLHMQPTRSSRRSASLSWSGK